MPFRRLLRWLVYTLLALFCLSVLLVVVFMPMGWPIPASSVMLQQSLFGDTPDGQPAYAYRWAPYTDIAPVMALAVIAAEDQRFPEHNGFDFTEIQNALEDWQEGEGLRGASTLSQQVAKNLYLWQGQDWLRKAIEAWFTLGLELFWSKERILEVYLNIAEMGGGQVYGVGAASWLFFSKSPAELSPEQAALLAATLPNPAAATLDAPSASLRRRQQWILRQMEQLGGVAYLESL